jgi:hypothetical protein
LDGFKDLLIMAKPFNLYQGPAPAAMGMMGQGIIEAGANIGRTLQGGYESMGKGIASGITAAADAYVQYKEDQAKFDATKKMVKVFGNSLDENQRKEIDSIFADTSMSVREKNALAPTLMQYLGAANQQQQALAKQKAELDAALARTQFSEGAATGRTKMGVEGQLTLEQQRAKHEALKEKSGGGGFGFNFPQFGIGTGGGAASYNQQYGN